MNYGEVLSKAWHIIWRHKVLWLFGILAGCGSAGGNASSSGSNTNYRFGGGDGNLPPSFENFGGQVERFIENIPFWVWIALILAGLVLMVIAILLTTIGKIGLIRGASRADDGATRLSFGPLFSESMPYFLRVFGLNLLVGLAIFALIAVMLLFGVLTLGVGLLCLVPLLCVAVPLGWFLGAVIEQSNVAIVTEDRGILSGLQRGWEVATKNLGPILVMIFILFLIGLVSSALVAVPLLLAAGPLVAGTIAGGENALRAGLIGSVAAFCLYLPILLIFNGIIQAYITSAWTLTFRRLTGRGPNAAAAVDVVPEPAAY